MSEWMQGFTTGLVGTVIGFALTMLWDLWKAGRDRREKDGTVMSVVLEEIDAVTLTLTVNQLQLEGEVKALQEHRALVSPLPLLDQGAWELVKQNMPRRIAKSPAILGKLRSLAHMISMYNEHIRSRENYRINNGAMDNFERRLGIYDQGLLQTTATIQTLLNEISELLGSKKPPEAQ